MKDMKLVSDFVTRWFRDSADRDYVSARAAFRNEFAEQFRVSGLEAVHKYLQAVLLYNGRSSKSMTAKSADMLDAFERVCAIEEIGFDVPEDVVLFIRFLARHGDDRYMRHPDVIPLAALHTLDKTVWHLRRFCTSTPSAGRRGLGAGGGRRTVRRVNHSVAASPHKFRLADGLLERVMDERLPAYRDLTWKNAYFGRNRKPEGSRPRLRVSSLTPVEALPEEVFHALRELVDFPQHILDRYVS